MKLLVVAQRASQRLLKEPEQTMVKTPCRSVQD